MNKNKKHNRRWYRTQFETCEPRLLLTAVADNDVLEIGTNLNFLHQQEHTNLLSTPTGSANADGTQDVERLPFAFRNGVDWANAYNFDAATGLSSTNPWRQEFLDDLDIYSQLRFIHWTNTNGSGIEAWSERTDPNTDQTQLSLFGTTNQGVNNGVAWEWAIDLGNRLGKDIWINIPLKANDAYVQNLASLVEERLDPGLQVYVEYHNELWLSKNIAGDTRNTSQFATEMAVAEYIDDGTGGFGNVLRWQAHRSAEIWNTFRSEFGSSFDSRVVKVVAGQTANVNVGEQIRDNLRDPAVNRTIPLELEDTYAVAPYFAAIEAITDPDDFAFLDTLAQAQVAQAGANVAAWDTVGTPVIAYEGGQSITGANASTDQIIYDINFDSRIKDVYLDYLQGLEDVGLESFNHFTHSGQKLAPGNTSDDSWGAKAYIGQPIAETPKFAALAEFAGVAVTDGELILHDGAVATYDAAGSVANSSQTVGAAAPWVTAVTAGDLTIGAGVNPTNGSFGNRFAPRGWDSTTLAGAIATDEYVSFTVTVQPGFTLDVNALDGILLTQGQTRNFALLSSATGFDTSGVISDFGGPITGTFGQEEVTVDLFQAPGIQQLTGTTEFRIYAYGGNPNAFESVGIGGRNGFDFKLSGQVREEPTTNALLVDEVIGSYDTHGSVRLSTTEIVADSAIVPVDVSPVSSGPGVTAANAWYTNRFAPRQWTSTTLTSAIANNDYLTFSVDVAPGYSLDVSEIDAYLFTQNQRARNFALFSSATGFTASDVLSDFGGTVTGSSNHGQEARTATVGTTGLTGSVEFRIYVYGSTNTNKWEAVGLGNQSGDELSIVGTLNQTSGGPAVIYDGEASSFDTAGSVRNSTTSIAAEPGSTLFTTSDLAPGPGLSATNAWYNNRFAPINWNSATLSDAIANDDYLTFDLTVAPGASLDLTEISAYLFTQNKKSRTFALLSDATGFNTASVLTDFGGAVTGSANNGQEARVADLTGAPLQGLSGTVEFRIYVYGSVNVWEAVGIGNRAGTELSLSGEVTL